MLFTVFQGLFYSKFVAQVVLYVSIWFEWRDTDDVMTSLNHSEADLHS